MPKINQEEYETLKKKQEKGHKYIAREKEGHVIVFTDYHGKSEYRWLVTINEDDLKYESLFNSSKVFQFIKWEDEEPYNISELIEEYLYDNRPKLFIDGQEQSFEFIEESEETEVKSKQELIEKWESAIEAAEFYGKGKEDRLIEYMRNFVDDLNRLDEPEVLSQELPVIPQFVADYINKQKEFGYSFLLAYEVISDSNKRHEADEKLVDYIQKNQDDFVRAWYGYEIEPEPQYRLKAGENYLYFNLDGTVRGSTKKNAAITKERLEELPFDVEMAVESGIIEIEEVKEC